ncbi:MAG: hypothetical protein IT385_09070 [Deltaproteobacteria bacterium]|nr:hypothetical protein [Deltaproteobacteria bacterium]
MESASRSWTSAARFAVAVAVTTVATGEAGAVPNPRCAGACEDGVTACGGASDCDAGRCAFPDACLPGFAGLIEAVLPEAPGGVDDPTTWSCGALSCRVEGEALRFASTFGVDAMAVKDLVLEPGRRYLVRAEMRSDPGAWGWLEVSGEDLLARAPELVGEEPWRPTSVVVDLPAGSTPRALQLRLHAGGEGELGIRRVVVYVLGTWGVWLRLGVAEPADVGATFELARVLRHVDDPPGPSPRPCADGPLAGCVDPRFASFVAEPGGRTPWIEVSAMFAGGERATLAWDVATDGAEGDQPLSVLAEVAWAPDPATIIWADRLTVTDGAPRFALALPEGAPSPDVVRAHIGWVRDAIADDRASLTPAARSPQRVALGAMVNEIDEFDAWPAIAEGALALEVELGLNAASYLTAVPRAEDHALARSLGLTRRIVDASALLPADATYDLDLAAIRDEVRARLSAPRWTELAGALADPDDALALTGPMGRALAGPAYRAAFHAWLAERAAADGLAPEDLGVARFEDVPPLEGSVAGAGELAARRPDPIDPHAARRFVWAWRFWQIAVDRLWDAARDAWREATDTAWRLLGELDATTMPRASGGMSMTLLDASAEHDCHVWDIGFAADRAAGHASPWRTSDYALLARVDAARGDLGRKLLELMVRGFDAFELARYGPHDLAYSGAGGGLGARSRPWLDRVARAAELVAAAEGPLAGARRAVSPVVILGAESDAAWTDLAGPTPDELGWHMALSQSHVPVDVMPESEIAAGRLEGPDAPRRLLFVLRRHVSKEAFVAIRRWVEGGGTLVLGPDIASHDELGQLDIERATWLAIAPGTAEEGAVTVQWLTPDGLATFEYDGPTSQLVGVGATTLAVVGEDRPVVVRVPRGRGRVLAIGLRMGEVYRRPVDACDRRPAALPPIHPGALSGAMRRAMASVASPLDAIRDVTADDPRLSIHALSAPTGPVVVVVSWASEPIDVVLSAAAWRGCDLVHEHVDDFTLPVIFGSALLRIDRAAVLTWDPSACERPAVVEPVVLEDAREEDVRPRPADDDGCSGGAPAGWLALALVAVARARRRAPTR